MQFSSIILAACLFGAALAGPKKDFPYSLEDPYATEGIVNPWAFEGFIEDNEKASAKYSRMECHGNEDISICLGESSDKGDLVDETYMWCDPKAAKEEFYCQGMYDALVGVIGEEACTDGDCMSTIPTFEGPKCKTAKLSGDKSGKDGETVNVNEWACLKVDKNIFPGDYSEKTAEAVAEFKELKKAGTIAEYEAGELTKKEEKEIKKLMSKLSFRFKYDQIKGYNPEAGLDLSADSRAEFPEHVCYLNRQCLDEE